MNVQQKELAALLMQPGHYMMPRMNNNGDSVYCVYQGKQSPVKYFPKAAGENFKNFLRKDKHNRLTLNLQLVRQMDGRKSLKKLYKIRRQL